MSKGSQANDELARFLAGKPVDIGKTLKDLPRTADHDLALQAVFRLIDHGHWFASSCAVMPVGLVRKVLAAEHPGIAHLFMRLAAPSELPVAKLKAAWKRGAEVLRDLADTTYPFEHEIRRDLFSELAGDAAILGAIQAVVAHRPDPTIEMLAILAIDGGPASVDALIPHLDPALGERDARLEKLMRLRPLAKETPALASLFAEVGTAVVEYRKSAPALAIAKTIGVAATDVFWFQFLPTSDQYNDLRVPKVQGNIRVDSREDPWFSVWITTVAGSTDRSGDRETKFDNEALHVDQLALGRCEVHELPKWLSEASGILGVTWRFVVQTNSDRKRIEQWLHG